MESVAQEVEAPQQTRRCLIDLNVALLRQLEAARRETDEATRDRDAYRLVAQQSIHALAELTAKHQRQTERYHALLDQCRETRKAA